MQHLIFPLLLPSLRMEAVNVWIFICSFLYFSSLFPFKKIYFMVVGWGRKEVLGRVGSWGTGGLVWFQLFVVVHSLQYTFCFYLTFCDLWIQEKQISAVTSLYLLCCILRIVKIKDLANTVAASLFCPLEAFIKISETKLNGYISGHGFTHEREQSDSDNLDTKVESGSLRVTTSNLPGSSQSHQEDVALQRSCSGSSLALR